MNANDLAAGVAFYPEVMGFANDGTDNPFTVLWVSDDFTVQLAPWGTR